jgi:hypothetical protein
VSISQTDANGDWEGTPEFSDFVVEVEVQVVSGGKSEDDVWFVVLRDWREPNSPPHGFYGPEGRPATGQIALRKWGDPRYDRDGPPNLLPYSPRVLKTGYETNHVLVVLKGSWIALYVNGRPVGLGYDELWSRGTVGLAAGTGGDTPLEVHFDNLKIWDISGLP